MPFPQAPTGARRILGRWRRSGWLWCCARSCWWCSRCMTKRSSPVGSGRWRRGAWRTWLAWGSLSSQSRSGLSGACRNYHFKSSFTHAFTVVCEMPLPNKLLGSFINDCLDLFDELLGLGLPDGVLPLHHLQRVVWCVELCPQALNCPDLHFEGAGNGPVVITWIGREHELHSSPPPILLVEHCVTFRHDRRLLSLLGFVHNWPTSRWSGTKKENRFSLNGNGIMSSFLGRQFYRSTL